jgi:hypothetical protein
MFRSGALPPVSVECPEKNLLASRLRTAATEVAAPQLPLQLLSLPCSLVPLIWLVLLLLPVPSPLSLLLLLPVPPPPSADAAAAAAAVVAATVTLAPVVIASVRHRDHSHAADEHQRPDGRASNAVKKLRTVLLKLESTTDFQAGSCARRVHGSSWEESLFF